MNEDLQRKYIEFQLFDQQLKQFQQQLQILRQQLNELSNLDEHLNEIDKVKEGSKIMAPLGAGVFVKAEKTIQAGGVPQHALGVQADIAIAAPHAISEP